MAGLIELFDLEAPGYFFVLAAHIEVRFTVDCKTGGEEAPARRFFKERFRLERIRQRTAEAVEHAVDAGVFLHHPERPRRIHRHPAEFNERFPRRGLGDLPNIFPIRRELVDHLMPTVDHIDIAV